ncbi:MAG: ribosomal protein S18-alanine N-acetyltransferase [Pseudomonadota bacterium]
MTPRALTLADLDAVMCIEVQAYAFPWTRGNFIDSLAAGYWTQGLFGPADGALPGAAPALLAYAWALPGVQEVHLLNLTVAPWAQRRGHARRLLDQAVAWARGQGAEQLWLEVRPSNLAAISLYRGQGFQTVGLRPGYYPAAQGQREDATVMVLALPPVLPAFLETPPA